MRVCVIDINGYRFVEITDDGMVVYQYSGGPEDTAVVPLTWWQTTARLRNLYIEV